MGVRNHTIASLGKEVTQDQLDKQTTQVKGVVNRLLNIQFEEIVRITQKDNKGWVKLFPEKQQEIVESIRDFHVAPDRAIKISGIHRDTFLNWCKLASEGKEPYFSGMQEIKRVALGWVRRNSAKIDTQGDAKTAQKELARALRDDQPQSTPPQTAINADKMIQINVLGVNEDDLSGGQVRLARRIIESVEGQEVDPAEN